ncbi:potassium/proton antiporter membrane subunit (CPA2 family) [Hydrogenivirga caldilitoris]|uniref:Potassium/proton antiporter membrane subunit (CPA2 family) n=1 Tax=Hydrogenivirga caldilitoris TaxID=246264 RepID=A0A497XQM3_9AQUI|nr:cation:proton antiporter [Hydrogenivirga caldilitoris]RLJ70581.1 potassium/proton antiporter membrane subunit (CPA2 family) [Hydrogenivirga caldilitoris]
MEHSLTFIQINLLFIIMFLSAYILKKVRVPPIISYLLVGFLAKFWVHPESTRLIELFKEAGIILLFFFIGLEYSFERLRNMVSIWKPGVVDLLFNFFPVFLLSLMFGFDPILSLLIAGVFYPSSTSIVAKLLMDFKRLASPEAELLIGILIFEDLVAIILLSVLIPVVEFGSVDPGTLPISLFKIVLVLTVFYLFYKLLMPKIQPWLDRVSEEESFVFFLLGLIMVIGVSFKEAGLSEALGAFLLGVLVPETRVMESIEHHLSALKELSIGIFFFFFAYESSLSLPQDLRFVLLLIALGIVLKVISTYLAAYLYGMKKKTRLRTSLSFVPRGEFSVVIASLEPSVKILSIPFIFATALIGSFLFVIAPRVADIFYPPKKKPPKKKAQREPFLTQAS